VVASPLGELPIVLVKGRDEGGVGAPALDVIDDFSEGANKFLGEVGVAGLESGRGVGVDEESLLAGETLGSLIFCSGTPWRLV